MNLFLAVFVFLSVSRSWAGEVSLIDGNANVAKEAVVPEKKVIQEKVLPKDEVVEGDFKQMKEFMDQENERLKTIKILNLDLERASLELKKREVEIKLADLNKDRVGVSVKLDASVGLLREPVFKVLGVFVNGNARQAMMSMEGVLLQVHEGQSMRGKVSVKSINADSVILEYPDGQQETIGFGA